MWPADLLFDSLKRKGFNCRVVLFGHDASPKYPKGVSSNIREIASKLVRHVENAQPHVCNGQNAFYAAADVFTGPCKTNILRLS